MKFVNFSRSNCLLWIFLFLGFGSFFFSLTRSLPEVWSLRTQKVEGEVIEIVKRGEEGQILIRDDRGQKLRVFVSWKEDDTLLIGDILSVTGTMTSPSTSTIPYGFSYRNYLWYHREKVVFYADNYEKIGVTRDFFLGIRRFVQETISERKNAPFLSLCLLGDDSYLDSSVIESYHLNGISHLFVISGMHFSVLFLLLSKFFQKLSLSQTIRFFLTSFFLFVYLFFLNFPPSSFRAFCFLELRFFSETFSLSLTKRQVYFFTMAFFLCFHPFFFFDLGFQFSMILSFFFLFSPNSKLSFSLLPFFAGLPLSLLSFSHVNFLSLVWNLFFIPFVTFFFFPIQLFSFFCPFLSSFCLWLGTITSEVSLFLSHLSFLTISFPHPPVLWILCYYLFLFFFLQKRRKKFFFLLLFFLLFFLYYKTTFFPSTYFLMIDVGQGDCLLFHSENHTMLLDTGGLVYEENHSLYYETIKPLLESLGIRRLDALVLSHGDYDHVGEALLLIQDFPISQVYFNTNAFSPLEEEIRLSLDKEKIPYRSLDQKETFSIGKFSFTSLHALNASENASSTVLFGHYQAYSFLLMGDATIETEAYLMNHYTFPPLLFLKVGHHGSNTSSSSSFIHSLDIQYALISVGRKNRYGHPSQEVLDTLSENPIFRTDLDGSVKITFWKNHYRLTTFPPL